jgi:hypothetical protein
MAKTGEISQATHGLLKAQVHQLFSGVIQAPLDVLCG